MTFPIEIKDATGSEYGAKITSDHALLTTSVDRDSFETEPAILTRYKLFRGFLTNGTNKDLNVNGSVTPVNFSVTSVSGKVLYISQLRVVLKDTYLELDTQDFRRFGTATAGTTPLTNGLTLIAKQGGENTLLFAEPVKTIGQFLDYADDFTNLKNSVGSQEDFLSFDFHFEQPIVLPEAVTDKLVMTVQDDLTAVDEFRVLVRGWQEAK